MTQNEYNLRENGNSYSNIKTKNLAIIVEDKQRGIMQTDRAELAIQEYLWEDVEKYFHTEPELIEIIRKLTPGKEYPVFKVSYPFGAKIFERGIFYLPDAEKRIFPITDSKIPHRIQDHLNYNTFPLGFLMGSGGVEVYTELEDRIFSLAYFEHGLNVGIWEMLAPPTPFTVIAGARSLHMLPKITEMGGHKRLKQRFSVTSSIPSKPFDQWYLFREIANHKNFEQPWTCEILFFSSKWMKKIKSDSKWRPFYNFILQRAWNHTEYSRSKIYYDFLWNNFTSFLEKNRIKPNSYIVDTLKHLIFVATGAIPAFMPATSNKAAPVDGLLKAYLEGYGLKTYAPTMMQPHHFSINVPNDFVYYSLQVPTYLESIPKYRSPSSARIDLAELIELMDRFMRELISNKLLIGSGHHIYEILSKIQFDYFHSEEDKDAGIYSSSGMPLDDERLLYMPQGYERRKFCERSTFVRGCVRISKKIL